MQDDPGIAPVSESKVLKKNSNIMTGVFQMWHWSQIKQPPMVKVGNNLNNKANKIVLDYNPKYEINIHVLIIIK